MNLLVHQVPRNLTVLSGELPAAGAGREMNRQQTAVALVVNQDGSIPGVITTEKVLQALLEGKQDVPISDICLRDVKRMQTKEWLALQAEDLEQLYHNAASLYLLLEGDKVLGILTKERIGQHIQQMLRAKTAELQQRNTELQLIFDHSFDEIYVADGKGVTLYVNQACERTTGKPPSYFIGRSCYELEQDGDIIHSVNPKVIATKKRQTGKIIVNKKQFIVTANPVLDDEGEIYRIISNVREVTELAELQKRLEEAEELVGYYREELSQLRNDQSNERDIIASSKLMSDIMQLAQKIAVVDSTVLLLGESGVGKGVMAKYLHEHSLRKEKPFVHINCGAIPANLLESELFGYEAGAFTGAEKQGKMGLIESADKGTLFLDEIAELPPALQVKILQVIQEKRFMKVGGKRPIEVDVRIIAATHRDLKEMVKKGEFREDLFYRIHVIPIHIPAVRYRTEDIKQLINHFLLHYNGKFGRNVQLDDAALQSLLAYHWPGNVREIENLLERLIVTVEKNMIKTEDLPEYLQQAAPSSEKAVIVKAIIPIKEAIEEVEKQVIMLAWNESRTSRKMGRMLGINQTTVLRKMQKYQIGGMNDRS